MLFELVCGLEVKHILTGDHDWIHNLRCDIILAEVVAGTPSRLPYEAGLQRAAVSDQKCEKGWPMMRSEAMFMISLVQHFSDPWHIYALRSDPEQSWSYSVVEKIRVDAEAMREKELKRLEYLFALKLLKNVMEPAQTSNNKQRTVSKRKRKGHKGKGKGDVSEESDGSGIDPHGLGPEEDPPHGGAPAPEEDPPHGDAPGSEPPVAAPEVAALEEDAPLGLGPETAAAPPPPRPEASGRRRARSRVGEQWGRGNWTLAPIRNSLEEIIGCGGTCRDHIDCDKPHLGPLSSMTT